MTDLEEIEFKELKQQYEKLVRFIEALEKELPISSVYRDGLLCNRKSDLPGKKISELLVLSSDVRDEPRFEKIDFLVDYFSDKVIKAETIFHYFKNPEQDSRELEDYRKLFRFVQTDDNMESLWQQLLSMMRLLGDE